MTQVTLRWTLLALALAGFALNGCDPGDGAVPGNDAGMDGGDQGDAGLDGGDETGQEMTEPRGAEASAQIQAVRDVRTAPAALDPALPVEGVAVTYVRSELGADPAGFFVQAEAAGPALFVAVDPAGLDPVPEVGDLISFHVHATTVVDAQHRVTGIEGLTLHGSGYDVLALVQDVSGATDVVSELDGYESELLVMDATLDGALEACGALHVCGAIRTDGFPATDEGLRVRLAEDLVASSGLRTGCSIAVGPTPLWRFEATAQASAWTEADLGIVSCPGLRALSAAATSLTTLSVRFAAALAVETVTADAFTLTGPSGPLAVLDAVVAGDTVTLTTAAQAPDTFYSLAIAQTITDVDGIAVEPDTELEIAPYRVAAGILVNEAELNAAGGCDLVEVRVIASGPMGGVVLRNRTSTPLFTFPEGFFAQTNDLIVVHMGKNLAACNGGVVPEDELNGPGEVNHPSNLPGAYDFWAEHGDVDAVNNVLFLLDREGGYLDFVPFHTPNVGSITGSQVTPMQNAHGAGAWDPPTSGGSFYTTGNYRSHAVEYLADPSEGTLQRTDNADTNNKTGWGQAAPSIGSLNAGQSGIL